MALAWALAGCAGSSGELRADGSPVPVCGRLMLLDPASNVCSPLKAEVVEEEVAFASEATPGGQIELRGTLSRPHFTAAGKPPSPLPVVVLVGGTAAASRRGEVPGDEAGAYPAPILLMEDLASGLAQQGYVVLRYDDRMCHAPTCTYPAEIARAATWADMVGDIVAAARFVAAQPDADPADVIVIGHSRGATQALEAAPRVAGLRELVLLAAPFYPIDAVIVRRLNWVIETFREYMSEEQLDELQQRLAMVESSMLAVREGQLPDDARILGLQGAFWEAWIDATSHTAERVGALPVPLLYLRGSEDPNASADDSDAFKGALAGHSGDVLVLPAHNHGLGRVNGDPRLSGLALSAVAEWLGRSPQPSP